MAKGMLIDVTKCMGCRGCQVACKEWNDLPAETTACFGCYDNPEDLSPITWNRVEFYEYEQDGQVNWFFRPVRCMHCLDAPCVRACPTGALYKHELGFIIRSALERSINASEIIVAVDKNDGNTLGFVHYHHRKDGQTTLYNIAVNPAYQKRGIGAQLIDTLRG